MKKSFFKGFGLLLAVIIAVPQAFALDGFTVVSGTATLEQNGNTWNVTTGSARTIIRWDSFNVGDGVTVNFIQPGSNSSVLNRIWGGPSTVSGNLFSNGQLFFVNPQGFNITSTANINAASFVASTLNITDQNFLNGTYRFARDASPAGVVNEGNISVQPGGFVVFAGSHVANTGNIFAPGGTVNLAVGDKIQMTVGPNHAVELTVDEVLLEKFAGVQAAIANGGTIEAGQIDLTANLADNFYTHVINNSGTLIASASSNLTDNRIRLYGVTADGSGMITSSGIIEASGNGIRFDGGRVEMVGDRVEVTGRIAAQGTQQGKGGGIHTLGNEVALYGNAVLDASGGTGGGEILVGGDYAGENPDIQNASKTWVTSNVSLQANAENAGDGGKVIVWADNSTRFYGTAEAKGGSVSGDGGFVEISGKQTLDFMGDVDTRAPNGKAGTVLFDPTDIVIIDGGPGADDGQLADFQILNGDAPATMTISENQLESLAAGTNIILRANNDITLNDLTDNVLAFNTGNGNSIELRADFDQDGFGNFTMLDSNDTLRSEGGRFNIYGSTLTLGNIDTTGALGTESGIIYLNGDTLDINGTLTAGASDVHLRNFTASRAIEVGAGLITDAEPVGAMRINQGELDLITADRIFIGTTGATGGLVVDGPVTINSTGGINYFYNSSITIDPGASVTTNDTGLALYGDTLDIDGTIDTGLGFTYLYNLNIATPIEVGAGLTTDAEPVGAMRINQGELDLITADRLLIGKSSDTGGLTVDGNVTFSNITTVVQLIGGQGGFTLDGAAHIDTNNTPIAMYGNSIDIDGTVNAGTGYAAFYNSDATTSFVVDNSLLTDPEPLGVVGISQAELDRVTTSRYVIGDSGDTNTTVTVAAPINVNNRMDFTGGTFEIQPGGSVTTNENLMIVVANTVDINGAIDTGINGNTSTSYLRFSLLDPSRAISIGTGAVGDAEPIGSLRINQGELDLISTSRLIVGNTNATGGLVIDGPIVSTFRLDLWNAGTVVVDGTVDTSNNFMVIRADSIDINAAINVGSGGPDAATGLFQMQAANDATPIEVGAGLITDAEPVGALRINQGELDLITAGRIIVGSTGNTGGLTLDSALNVTTAEAYFSLQNAGNIVLNDTLTNSHTAFTYIYSGADVIDGNGAALNIVSGSYGGSYGGAGIQFNVAGNVGNALDPIEVETTGTLSFYGTGSVGTIPTSVFINGSASSVYLGTGFSTVPTTTQVSTSNPYQTLLNAQNAQTLIGPSNVQFNGNQLVSVTSVNPDVSSAFLVKNNDLTETRNAVERGPTTTIIPTVPELPAMDDALAGSTTLVIEDMPVIQSADTLVQDKDGEWRLRRSEK